MLQLEYNRITFTFFVALSTGHQHPFFFLWCIPILWWILIFWQIYFSLFIVCLKHEPPFPCGGWVSKFCYDIENPSAILRTGKQHTCLSLDRLIDCDPLSLWFPTRSTLSSLSCTRWHLTFFFLLHSVSIQSYITHWSTKFDATKYCHLLLFVVSKPNLLVQCCLYKYI